VHFDNTTPQVSAATEIAFNYANSDMLRSHPTARISVHVALSIRRTEKETQSTRWRSSKRELRNYLVNSNRKQCNESLSTGSKDCSKWYTPMESTSKTKYYHSNSTCVEQWRHR
jgi:hypothetical protein